METATNIFKQLFKATEKHVKNYRTDFDHDKKSIEENPGEKFIHIARANGTHLTRFFKSEIYPKQGERVKYLFSATADRKELLKSNLETLEHYLKRDPLKIHFFNGEKLIKINVEKAKTIYLNYYNSLLYKWEQEEKQTA
jgi:hypothetical protein